MRERDNMDASLRRPVPSGVGRVSQWFGENPEKYRALGLAGHNGIDYAAPLGTPVLAAHEGIVTVGEDPAGYGLFVRVVNGYRVTIYAHLSAITRRDGERVQAGEQIGLSGNTGWTTGAHLHFGLKWIQGTNPAYLGWVDRQRMPKQRWHDVGADKRMVEVSRWRDGSMRP